MAVPNIFGTATAAIPLSQLDQNFATAITLGNTAVYLGNTTTSLGNVTLTNVTISSGTSNIAANVSIAVGLLPEANGGTGTTTGYYGFKNRIINGNMAIDQRNGGAAVTINSTAETYTLDRWLAVGQSSAGVYTLDQVQDAPSGFIDSLKVTVTTQDATLGAGEYYWVQQKIEGYNAADLAWGSASAKSVTLSFWVKSSVTGTFSGAFSNSSFNYSYAYEYTINTANTWEQKTISIIGAPAGTWLTTNGIGVRIYWDLGVGTTYTGVAGSWQSAGYTGSTGSTKLIQTLNATWQITGVQLEKGSTATSFDYRPYGTELALCQRYYYKVKSSGNSFNQLCTGYNGTTTQSYGIVFFPVELRTRPTSLETSGTASDYSIAYENTAATCDAVPTYAAQSNQYQGMCNFTVASGLTAGQGSRGCSSINNASAFLAWSAEL